MKNYFVCERMKRHKGISFVFFLAFSVLGLVLSSCEDEHTVIEHHEERIELSFAGDVDDFIKDNNYCKFSFRVHAGGDLYKGDSIVYASYTSEKSDFITGKPVVFYKMWGNRGCIIDFYFSARYIIDEGEQPKKMSITVKKYMDEVLTLDTTRVFETIRREDIPRDDSSFFTKNYTFRLKL